MGHEAGRRLSQDSHCNSVVDLPQRAGGGNTQEHNFEIRGKAPSALRDKLAEGDMCGLNVIALHRNRGIASLFTSFRRRLPAQVSVPKGRDPAVEHVLHLCKDR